MNVEYEDYVIALENAELEIEQLRQRVAELEAWVVRAQDAFRRALLLEIQSSELKELRDNAPGRQVQP
jgi:hypothetical protein